MELIGGALVHFITLAPICENGHASFLVYVGNN